MTALRRVSYKYVLALQKKDCFPQISGFRTLDDLVGEIVRLARKRRINFRAFTISEAKKLNVFPTNIAFGALPPRKARK